MSFRWIVLDPGSGQAIPVERFPFLVGGGVSSDLRLGEPGLPETLLELQPAGSQLSVTLRGGQVTGPEGNPVNSPVQLASSSDHGLLVQGQPVLFLSCRNPDRLQPCQPLRWIPAGSSSSEEGSGFSSAELRSKLREVRGGGIPEARYRLAGTEVVFNLAHWAAPSGGPGEPPEDGGLVESLTGLKGRCPQCWMTFRPGEVLAISCHEDLRGDPVLGSAAMRRFLPRQFSEDGFPLDEMGFACRDLACPHCRHKLPLELFRLPFHILSLVGIQRAGKSYYLAILARILSQILARDFACRWEDLDPTGNIPLNDLRNRLFAAPDAESAALEKTALGGVMYTEVQRAGRSVAMPRPFTYRMTNGTGRQAALIFYDNAGEHFMPGIPMEESPGALHVTEASALLFLFDPLVSTEFRRHLQPGSDPQLDLHDVPDIQDVVLDEMRVRFARARGHAARDDLGLPFGVIVGKCDAWVHLVGGRENLRPVIRGGRLDLEALEHNSACTRDLLQRLCPEIVARLDALSSRCQYFPVSSFGHTPIRTSRGVAPDPKRLQPWLAEAPVLWALQQLDPGLIPTT